MAGWQARPTYFSGGASVPFAKDDGMHHLPVRSRWVHGVLLFMASIGIAQESIVSVDPDETTTIGDTTLEGFTRLAESNSPALRQALADIEVSRGKALQVGLYPNPFVSGGSPQWGGSESQYYGQLSQEIVTKGKLRLNRAAATREVTQAELRFVRTRFNLLTAVRRDFFATLAGQRRVEILSNLVDVAKQSEESVGKLQRGGEGSRADLLLIEIERQKAEVALENAQAMLDATRRQLAATVGIPETPIGNVTGELEATTSDFATVARSSGVLDSHAFVQIARTEADRARILLRRAQVEPHPNITLSGGYMQQTTFPNNIGLVSIEMPIPVWNRNQGNIRSARGAVSSATENVQRTYNELAGQLAMAVGRYEAAVQQTVRFEQAIIPKARESLEITRKGIAGGQFGFLTLLQAQRSIVEADLGYVNAQEVRWISAAEIAGLLQLEAFP
ncbi:TolC family protein [bacterium]|nr:TolC family protein [bacterium]